MPPDLPPIGDVTGARGYQSLPLTGTPVSQLARDTARMLASGVLPHCPHPEQPAFWFLAAGMLTCAPCTRELAERAPEDEHGCHLCGEPADAVAAWVTEGVPCIVSLCEPCHASGLVPLAPN